MEPQSPPTSPQRGGRPASRQSPAGIFVAPTLLQRALTEASRRENAEVRCCGALLPCACCLAQCAAARIAPAFARMRRCTLFAAHADAPRAAAAVLGGHCACGGGVVSAATRADGPNAAKHPPWRDEHMR
jgi:Na+/proline symporter